MSGPSSSSPEPPVFVAHALCPPHLRTIVEDAVEAFDNAWFCRLSRASFNHNILFLLCLFLAPRND